MLQVHLLQLLMLMQSLWQHVLLPLMQGLRLAVRRQCGSVTQPVMQLLSWASRPSLWCFILCPDTQAPPRLSHTGAPNTALWTHYVIATVSFRLGDGTSLQACMTNVHETILSWCGTL